MIILTNCLTEKADEGCLKVANSLTKRIKRLEPQTTVVSYGKASSIADCHYDLNKLFLNKKLKKMLRERGEPLLYIPFSSNTKASILRTWVLSRYCKKGVTVLFALRHPMSRLFGRILRRSGARVLTLSEESYGFFQELAPTVYLKTGVDTERFRPVTAEEKLRLRHIYGIPEDAKAILHVGHLKEGRNLRVLLDAQETFFILLAVSSQTEDQWDAALRTDLEGRKNLKLIDTFVEEIQHLYQLSDVYVFPVQAAGNCIDIPLSALEAAACGIPVVTTAYGELKSMIREEGFYELSSTEPAKLNEQLHAACREKKSPRGCVLEYDWSRAAEKLLFESHFEKEGV